MKTDKKLIIGITASQSIILLHGQLAYFSEMGYEVFLLTKPNEQVKVFCKKEKATLLPVNIEREINLFKDFFSLISIIKIFWKVKPDIVNLGTPKVSLLGMIAAGFLGVKKRIYTCRGFRFEHEKGFLRKLLIFFEKVTVLFAHKVVCISPSVQSLGIKEGIFKKEKTLITHKGSSNGIDLDLFNPETIHKTEIDQIKKTYNINNAFVIGYVGRIIERKGIKELFDSFKLLYSENKNLRLFIVGRPYYDQLSDPGIIKEMESHPGIILAGLQPINKVPLFLSVFDLFVLPAYWEGFGNVLVQAAAMGLPVISTNATGTKDAVNNGFNGILVKPKSVDELCKAIRLLYEDTALREKMGKNGLIWAKNFDRKLIWKSLEEIYQA